MSTLATGERGWSAGKVLVACWWIVPALLSANSFYLRALVGGAESSWASNLLVQLLVWSLWLIFTPLILRLGRRVRIASPRWWRGALFHGCASVVLTLAYLLFYTFVLQLTRDGALTASGFVQTYVGVFIAVFHWDVLIYWAILGAGYAIDYYAEARDREVREAQLERRLADAQLDNLRAQLQPHFLFNALHTIGSLIRHDRKDEAVRMLAGLSELLRLSLDTASEHETTLRDELEVVRRYLEIQRVRFQDRLKVQIHAAPDALNSRMPSLLLQPIVENAIRHGLDRQREAGRVEIRATRENESLQLEVFNDGPRLPADWTLEQSDALGGLGVKNTRERLRQLYGSGASLDLVNGSAGVVKARITIPQDGASS